VDGDVVELALSLELALAERDGATLPVVLWTPLFEGRLDALTPEKDGAALCDEDTRLDAEGEGSADRLIVGGEVPRGVTESVKVSLGVELGTGDVDGVDVPPGEKERGGENEGACETVTDAVDSRLALPELLARALRLSLLDDAALGLIDADDDAEGDAFVVALSLAATVPVRSPVAVPTKELE
jgi:hypothetical protein